MGTKKEANSSLCIQLTKKVLLQVTSFVKLQKKLLLKVIMSKVYLLQKMSRVLLRLVLVLFPVQFSPLDFHFWPFWLHFGSDCAMIIFLKIFQDFLDISKK